MEKIIVKAEAKYVPQRSNPQQNYFFFSYQITITNQGSAREWPKLCRHPLDFHYIPSAMGAAISLGLGLALAQPERHVPQHLKLAVGQRDTIVVTVFATTHHSLHAP